MHVCACVCVCMCVSVCFLGAHLSMALALHAYFHTVFSLLHSRLFHLTGSLGLEHGILWEKFTWFHNIVAHVISSTDSSLGFLAVALTQPPDECGTQLRQFCGTRLAM